MGMLVDGTWHTTWYDTKSTKGEFVRTAASFRNWITRDGAPGPSGDGGFVAEADRYHLYVSLACPWAHRTLIFRALKGLEKLISVDVVHPDMMNDGWSFAADFPAATGDTLFGSAFARDIYLRDVPDMTGRVTVPILWDKEAGTIVSNESSEIIRMLNSAFDDITGNRDDYYPEELRPEIDAVNARVYDTVNNGVYKSGFATSQEAYTKAATALFESLDWLDDRLSRSRYLVGDRLTEADWRLFTTLVRFDAVYHLHFKCNRKRLIDYPALWSYARELYQHAGVARTVNFDHIVRHYHYSHETINPHRIIPINPVIDWNLPHGREPVQTPA
ncbi:MAG: glutathione S-transferase family protein [Pseudomonadota bacterium]